MRRRSWLLWMGLGVIAVVVMSAATGIWALRRWPEKVVPKLPAFLAYRLVPIAGDSAQYYIGLRMNTDDAQSVIQSALEGSSDDVKKMCTFLHHHRITLQDSFEQRLYFLANGPDAELRVCSRAVINYYNRSLRWLARQVIAGKYGESQPGEPRIGVQARKALALRAFQGEGYDHRIPSKYKKRIKSLLADILASQDAEGRFAVDAEDNSIIVTAVAEAYAITNDAALLPPLQSAVAGLRSAWPSARVGGLWITDTRVAMAQLFAWKALVSGGVITRDVMVELRSDFDAAWAAAGPEYSHFPWYVAGHIQDIPAAESLVAAHCAAVYLGKTDLEEQVPLQRLSLPGDFRTMEGHWWASALFQRGELALVQAQWPKLRATQVYRWKDDADGSWDPVPGVGDRYLVSVFAILNQQFYTRYTPP